MMGTMVPLSNNAVEVEDERLRRSPQCMAELNQYRQRRVPYTSLNLREVFETHASALCDLSLGEP